MAHIGGTSKATRHKALARFSVVLQVPTVEGEPPSEPQWVLAEGGFFRGLSVYQYYDPRICGKIN